MNFGNCSKLEPRLSHFGRVAQTPVLHACECSCVHEGRRGVITSIIRFLESHISARFHQATPPRGASRLKIKGGAGRGKGARDRGTHGEAPRVRVGTVTSRQRECAHTGEVGRENEFPCDLLCDIAPRNTACPQQPAQVAS
jgi:hypothetical protein